MPKPSSSTPRRADLLPFPQLLFPRLRRALQRLALGVWSDPVPLEVARTSPRTTTFPYADAVRSPLHPVSIPSAWNAPGFSTSWFRLKLPRGFRPRPGDHLHWDDNAEATAWVNGEPLFGLDATHRQWPWPQGADVVWLESIFCQSGIWHAAAKGIGPVGSILAHARLVRKNEENWQAYFDLEVLTDWLEEEIRRALPAEAESLLAGFRAWPEMDSASSAFLPDGVGTGVANRFRPELDRLPALLRRVFRLLDEAVTVLHSDGVPALRRRLRDIYGLLRESADPVRATLTGHAHIDLVWLWPESTGEQKAVRTFATAERLLETYPDFVFGYSQPASYEAVARRAPGLMKRVRRRIGTRRWEPTGAMYIESDTLMACGEALLRSLWIGQKEFRRLQGHPSPVLWLPDAFGFPGCLPGLMRLAGVSSFFTNKLMWNMIHRFPHSSFVWRGQDGSEVLAHVSRATGYNNPARPRNLRLELEAHRQSDIHPEMLLPAGWGDGGGGPTADIIERVRRQTSLRNQPAAAWGRIDGFFERMALHRDALPVHCGEIYLEAHRGTLTTHGFVKEAYRRLECALQAWEAAHCATGLGPIPDHSWKRLVFAQFHDFLPGSSIHEVYEEMVPELEDLAKKALQAAKSALARKRPGIPTLFNPLPFPMAVRFAGKSGESPRIALLPPLTGLSRKALRRASRKAHPVLHANRLLDNGRIQARFDRQGGLTSLLVDGEEGLSESPRLVCYRDIPYDLEAWEIDRQALDTGRTLRPQGPPVFESGPDAVECRQTWKTPGGSEVILHWILRTESPVLEAMMDVDWKEPETLLRFEVPTPFRGQEALFGSPFGAEWRSQQPGDPRQSAQWEVPANRWALAADDGRREGLFLLAEAKYGFSVRDGILGVSLLKSAKVTLTTAFPPAFRKGPARHAFSDLGAQRIRLALGRLGPKNTRAEHPAALADTVFATPISGTYAVSDATPFPILEGMPSVVPVWAAPVAPHRWVLRLHETLGLRGRLHFTPPSGWKARLLSQAFPEEGKRTTLLQTGSPLEVTPFSILSVELFKA